MYRYLSGCFVGSKNHHVREYRSVECTDALLPSAGMLPLPFLNGREAWNELKIAPLRKASIIF